MLNSYHVSKKLAESLSSLSSNTIIMILQTLIEQEDDSNTTITNLINIPQFRSLIVSINDKQNISVCRLSLLNTSSWIRAIFRMGYDHSKNIFSDDGKQFSLIWGEKIIENQKKIITEKLYTSRVHDLIDIIKTEEIPSHIKIIATKLLDNLDITPETQILLQNSPKHNNKTIRTAIATAFNNNTFTDIKYWDVRQVTDMSHLFERVKIHLPREAFQTNIVIDLSYWDTSKVTTMKDMFSNENINVIGIKGWNTSRVKNMSNMFLKNKEFNSEGISFGIHLM